MARLSSLFLSVSLFVYVLAAPLPSPQVVPLLGDVDQDGIPFANLTLPSQGGEFPSFLEKPLAEKTVVTKRIQKGSNEGFFKPQGNQGGHNQGPQIEPPNRNAFVEEDGQGNKEASPPVFQQPSGQSKAEETGQKAPGKVHTLAGSENTQAHGKPQ
ncbi:hypothetical protein M422DRAFT_34215 [Sphaerobolus stellatus SS14]|uniref:Unplaced genomic scaffold SPHSTscaffold_102, whole genome shotgun sequence n=1 Tax=Sphaerobolus stellatus (strain SS14) TaxID=990650 RepID=A0A0C9U154_SPHS4|nr:hypothetical protein M422DRAFT_34215 [Sphaerobolus stellatus SS14]